MTNIEQHTAVNFRTYRNLFTTAIRLLLVITIACLFIPFYPKMPAAGLDNSWMFGMNEAIAQHMAFGRDVIFTFGPYASVYTKEYHPATGSLMLLGSVFLALAYTVGTLFLINKERWCLGLVYSLFLASLVYSRDSLLFSFTLIVAASAYKAMMLKETGSEKSKSINLALIILLFSLGLPALIKGSMLILCGAISILCFLLFVMKKEKALAVMSLALPASSMIFFWLVSGQSIGDMPAYIANMGPIASGYTDAMSYVGKVSEIWNYLLASAVLCAGLFANRRQFKPENMFLWCIFSVFLFLAFKGGFVRHDGHASMAAISLITAALIYLSVTSNKLNLAVAGLCILASFYIINNYVKTNTAFLKHNIVQTYTKAYEGISNSLEDSHWLDKKFSAAVNNIKESANLPILQGTTDIYSYSQSDLIASGNQWNPRPILQSYSVYTESLAIKNRDHLLGANAPDNIIFSVEPLDHRFPALEDGTSWPALLSNYHPTMLRADNRLFLAKNPTPTNDANPTTIQSAIHHLGEEISVPDMASPVFVELDIKPNLFGHLANILFKSAQLKIKVTLTGGQSQEYRLISGFTKSGFIISPLVESTSDFGMLFGDSSFYEHKRVKSFSIVQVKGKTTFWQNEFSVKFKSLDLPPPIDLKKLYTFDPVTDAQSDPQKAPDSYCLGVIDLVNGVPPTKAMATSSLLRVDGWLATSTAEGPRPATPVIVLWNKNGQVKLIYTRVSMRPDVGAALKNPDLDKAGYVANADVSGLDGEYSLSLGFKEADQVKICQPSQSIVTIGKRTTHADK
ncbi:hypothetical protein [Pseudomonas nunensis]|uniref:hypothetical protein n=1 Tax=Pseudomonas nunensis TaxID=2961896 RepID=UPI0006B69D05|nr:hypothetical protein [Pseudomonas nunensis]